MANTEAELRRAAEDLRDLPGFLGGGYGSVSNTVEQSVIYDDGSIRALGRPGVRARGGRDQLRPDARRLRVSGRTP
ncbi:hypothetical protein [Nocardioides sp. B-3]|uniref:hypothetical protein n=1 Tax=Nocardioides sp. B-3 TaxID=2895565 RepID=UPI002153982B|nr:hypothetical protein [Nocardioides sp. B-3]UUZ60474.1 hypothetical protein LP418_06215 [Nocardioides sp. B-3]